ncbi:shikimate dehydrogenase [Microbacterium sp. SLBN-154]|uniref:shikimate dehydrogenase n=1 Tax=Microbacterium sp. SLBN-154 TaxID=2768458 RepID=UPI00114D89C1|nr:shikimate dehydrogenase [Microbacterium sp. SLBN-154]TQK19554.1 shikimate dehydrogenase [Microbacterium sp. SLBN-154]
MLRANATRLAVWGDPIAHSRSPQLHSAAYAELGLPWTYERRRVSEAQFDAALADPTETWRGLSLTMPLKHVAARAATALDRAAQLSGAANTLIPDDEGIRGFNTDVAGLVAAIREEGIERTERGTVLGAGATATSALLALEALGAREIEIRARRPDAAGHLVALAASLDLHVTVVSLDAPRTGSGARPDTALTIATLPGDAELPASVLDAVVEPGGLLVDVVYGTWPTPLAAAWEGAGGRAVSGLPMLLHQAVRQVRIFTTGDVDEPLPSESVIVASMRRALMED